jgi:hypothetical protein
MLVNFRFIRFSRRLNGLIVLFGPILELVIRNKKCFFKKVTRCDHKVNK